MKFIKTTIILMLMLTITAGSFYIIDNSEQFSTIYQYQYGANK